jgi:hypothetical protein
MRRLAHFWGARAKHAIFMRMASNMLPQRATYFSDGSTRRHRSWPTPRPRWAGCALLKTRNRYCKCARRSNYTITYADGTLTVTPGSGGHTGGLQPIPPLDPGPEPGPGPPPATEPGDRPVTPTPEALVGFQGRGICRCRTTQLLSSLPP